ncbi:MAG: isopentenyl phosphate kinase [Candidatus Micrarchaeia archaeon]
MNSLYLLKFGGSMITDLSKPNTPKQDAIRRVLKEVDNARKEGNFNIILGHGSGSFAHIPAKQYSVNEGIINKDSRKGAALTYLSAKELNNIVINTALDLGIDAFPFSPSSFGLAEEGKIIDGTVAPIETAMEKGFLPIVYGDVSIDKRKGVSIASTEEVFRFIASKMMPKKVFLATDVTGVYDRDPKEHDDARLIKVVDKGNIMDILQNTGSSKGRVDVTGGMRGKLSNLYYICKETGAEGYIFNALDEGVIKDILLGRYKGDYTIVKG